MPEKSDLQPHIYLPVPNPKDLPKDQSKEQRLKTILKNLETNQNIVRQRLITAAKHRAHQDQFINGDNTDEDVQMTDDHDLSFDQESKQKANELLLANLSAPYIEGSGDPCTPLPAPPQDIPQATPPPEIALAKEVLDQIELYDKHALPAKEYYKKALKRMTGPPGGVPQRTYSGMSNGSAANASPVDPRLAGRRG